MRHGSDRFSLHGFTLVEMIVSIVIGGILVSMVAMFGRGQINAYFDVTNRADLSDAADTALRRIARDLQAALPNSVRNTSSDLLEYVPIRDAGRYRANVDTGGAGNPLDFTNNSDTSFDVLGPPVTIGSGEELVIYNLGQAGSDVYADVAAGSSRRSATAGANLSTVTFAPGGGQFPFASPQSRFQIIAQPITYQCDVAAGVLRRHTGYGFLAAQPTTFVGAQSSILVDSVSACSFSYTPAVLRRNGMAVLRLTLTRNGESVQLLHQVAVLNTP